MRYRSAVPQHCTDHIRSHLEAQSSNPQLVNAHFNFTTAVVLDILVLSGRTDRVRPSPHLNGFADDPRLSGRTARICALAWKG